MRKGDIVTSAAIARRVHQRRRQRRKRTSYRILIRIFLAWEIVVGGLSGILLGAIILNAIQPGHPFYVAIRDWLCGLLGIPI